MFAIYKKRLSRLSVKKLPTIAIVCLLLIGIVLPVQAMTFFQFSEGKNRAIQWDVAINFSQPGGKTDYVVFGEAPDATDGPPHDVYDMPKPPTPPPSYIRAWFTDGLPAPYDLLLKDYRHYPDVVKIWNLYVIWIPSDYVSPTTITLAWLPNDVNDSEYDTVILYDLGNSQQVADMKTDSSYAYFTPALTTRHFQVRASSNSPPYTPSNPVPTNHALDIDINQDLSWTGGDPDGDNVTYDVYFGTNTNPPKVSSNQSATTFEPGTMGFNTKYYWKIVSWDEYSAVTTGPLWDFTTEDNNPPNVPSNPSPSNHQTGVSVTVILSWTGGDPDGDQVTYDVYFGVINPPPKVSSNQSITSYNPGTLGYGTTYYWRIIAWDEYGATTSGPTWDFTTQINNPPYTPSNPSPEHHATGVDVDADLSWTGGDPDGDTVTYDVYFGTSTNPPQVTSTTDTIYDPGTMNPNRKYYWRINARDTHGAQTNGPLWDFTTENNPPNTPHSPVPTNGQTGVGLTTIVSWQGGDPDPDDSVTYDVYLGATPLPPKVSGNQTENSYWYGQAFNENTTYYWKIVAWDKHGGRTEGDLWQFTTRQENIKPSVTITKPHTGCIYFFNTQLIFFFPATIIIGWINITADAYDDESGINRVEFKIDDQRVFTDYKEPYCWEWRDPQLIFPFIIKVIAYDNAGNPAEDSVKVWKLL